MRTRSVRAHISALHRTRQLEWCSPAQEELFAYEPFPLCASGGWNAGKTAGLVLKALYVSDIFPNNRGVIGRRVYEELKSTTMPSFFQFCPSQLYQPFGRRADSEKYLRLNNGSELLFMHFEDPDTANVIKGLEINWFVLDQAEEIDEQIFDDLLGRLGRWKQAEVSEHSLKALGLTAESWPFRDSTGALRPPVYAMISCNPGPESHWIYRRFHPESTEHWERRIPEMDAVGRPTGRLLSYHDLGYKMVFMSALDNRFLTKQNRDALLAHDELWVQRYVHGKWGIAEGQIHRLEDQSIVEGTPEILDWIRSHCLLHRTLDHGDMAPTCCIWWAVDTEGNLIAYREYYKPDALVSYHRAEITALSRDERYGFNLADPSIFFKTQQKYGGRWSVHDEYSDVTHLPRGTALWWQPADNNELGTRNRINEYLRADPEHVNPFTKQRGAPRIYFVAKSASYPHGCDFLVRETRAQKRKKVRTLDGRATFSDERDGDVPDHAYDNLRYMVASRPPLFARAKRAYGVETLKGYADYMDRFRRADGFARMAYYAKESLR